MPGAFGTADEVTLKAAALAEPGTDGVDLVAEVTTPAPYIVGDGPLRVVAYDFGIKATMLRHLGALATVEVVPGLHAGGRRAGPPARRRVPLQRPGRPDDGALRRGRHRATCWRPTCPIFGICLGHQLLGPGHRRRDGASCPSATTAATTRCSTWPTATVEITSQNHNFAVAADSLAGRAEVTHVNLNDGVCEGLRVLDARAFSVQYHPEAGPGPHDSRYLFEPFRLDGAL